MQPGRSFQLFLNPRAGTPGMVVLTEASFRRARAEITVWEGYAPTPLRDLPSLAAEAGIGVLRAKIESARFRAEGVGSFKALGAAFAIGPALDEARAAGRPLVVACASAGNHGRALAWGAQREGVRCVVFLPETVEASSRDAIAALGAECRIVAGSYEETVRIAAETSATEGWALVSDTSWPSYTEIPRRVMQGYRMMADEALADWEGAPPTHVVFQAGVGGGAAAVSTHLRTRLKPAPMLIVVEPERAACLLASAELGELTTLPAHAEGASRMVRLDCQAPSLLAWQELERGAGAFMAIPDLAAEAMAARLAGLGCPTTPSGGAGLAGLFAAAADAAARAELGLGPESRVLAFVTE